MTVSPQQIGGLRLANAVALPHVTEFFERVLLMPGGISFQELLVTDQSPFCNKPLKMPGYERLEIFLSSLCAMKMVAMSSIPGPTTSCMPALT